MGCSQSSPTEHGNVPKHHESWKPNEGRVKTPNIQARRSFTRQKSIRVENFNDETIFSSKISPTSFTLNFSPSHKYPGQPPLPFPTPKSNKESIKNTSQPVETPRFIREYLDRMSSPTKPLTRASTGDYPMNKTQTFRDNAAFLPQASKFVSPRKVTITPKSVHVKNQDTPLTECNILRLSSNSSSHGLSPPFLSPQGLKGHSFSFRASAEAVSAVNGRVFRINTEDYSCNMNEDESEPVTARSQDIVGKQFTFLDSLKNLEDRRATIHASKSFISRRTSMASDVHSIDHDYIVNDNRQQTLSRFHTSVNSSSRINLLTKLERNYSTEYNNHDMINSMNMNMSFSMNNNNNMGFNSSSRDNIPDLEQDIQIVECKM